MKICVLTTLFNGNIMLRDLIEAGVEVDSVITLSPTINSSNISGFESAIELCDQTRIRSAVVDDYTLQTASAVSAVAELGADLFLILGWQRLVPQKILQMASVGALGLHGSARGIQNGRGRSPQNWALLLGSETFHLSLFCADAGIDSGPVIDTSVIPLSPWDDIRTSHYKVARASVQMIVKCLRNERAIYCARPQTGSTSRYLPQRLPEDGEIDWTRQAARIHDFVRAITRPYPGAFTELEDGSILRIWRSRPFVAPADPRKEEPGTVLEIFSDGSLLIVTGQGECLLVDDYDIEVPARHRCLSKNMLQRGALLPSANYEHQLNAIEIRHKKKHLNLPIASWIRS